MTNTETIKEFIALVESIKYHSGGDIVIRPRSCYEQLLNDPATFNNGITEDYRSIDATLALGDFVSFITLRSLLKSKGIKLNGILFNDVSNCFLSDYYEVFGNSLIIEIKIQLYSHDMALKIYAGVCTLVMRKVPPEYKEVTVTTIQQLFNTDKSRFEILESEVDGHPMLYIMVSELF